MLLRTLLLLASCLLAAAVSTPNGRGGGLSQAQTPPIGPRASPHPEGVWEGTLEVGTTKLRVRLTVTPAADGALTATFDSIDQGAHDLPVEVFQWHDKAMHFEMPRLRATFDGTLNDEGSAIAGQFRQGGASLPLTWHRVATPTVFTRPQAPQPPYPYDAEEVRYENTRDGVTLAGTLTHPRGTAVAPAVLLIPGSGAHTRDEEVMGHKPFLVLADSLTRRGIAVLRVDDRGVGGSTGRAPQATIAQRAADALAGLAFLKAHPGIHPTQIGLLGHSEGAAIAAMAAAQSHDVAFLVLLAGPGVPGDELLYAQVALLLTAQGASAAVLAQQRAVQERIYIILKQEPDPAVAAQRLREALTPPGAGASASEQGHTAPALEAQLPQLLAPWFRDFLLYDPRPTLAQVHCPVLVLHGEHDLQVPVLENTRAIEAALHAAGNPDVTVVRLPRLNHLFQTSETGLPDEYGRIEETIAPVALQTIGDWMGHHTHGPE